MKALLALGLLAAGLYALPSSQDEVRPTGQGLSSAAAPVQEDATPTPVATPVGLAARLAAVEAALAAERKRNDETRARLEQTIVYLHQRAEGSNAVLASLDTAEREGFTAGINFHSREILIGGLRDYWRAAERGLPAPVATPKPPPAPETVQASATPAAKDEVPAAEEGAGEADEDAENE